MAIKGAHKNVRLPDRTTNAFHLVSLAAFLRETSNHFPRLFNWVTYCYGKDTKPHLWVGDLKLRSVCGVQQGDPFGPLLFAIAIHPILTKLNEKLNQLQNENNAKTNPNQTNQLQPTPTELHRGLFREQCNIE